VCADSGYCSEDNLKGLEDRGIEAFIPDNEYRERDARYQGREQHTGKPDALWDKSAKPAAKPKLFQPADFQVAEDRSHCICPAGKRLYRNGGNCNIGGRQAIKFSARLRDCRHCPLRARCLRHPQRTPVRQVAIFLGRHAKAAEKAIERMKRKIDTDTGREMIARRFATVEPVFGNLRYNKGLNRFTLRGRQKVDGQWKLYCLVRIPRKSITDSTVMAISRSTAKRSAVATSNRSGDAGARRRGRSDVTRRPGRESSFRSFASFCRSERACRRCAPGGRGWHRRAWDRRWRGATA